MSDKRKSGKRLAAWLLCLMLILSMVPDMGSVAYAAGYVKKGEVSAVSVTADYSVPTLGGVNACSDGYLVPIIKSPVNQNVSLVMVQWTKKNSDGEFISYYNNVFEPGVYRLNAQLRTDPFDDGSYYAIKNGTKLTVNGKTWTPEAAEITDWYETDGIGLLWFYGEEYVVDPAPEKYSVSVEKEGEGTASASKFEAAKGDVITLTAAPEKGYQFKEWRVVSGGITIKDNRFTMGTKNVVVKAIFEKLPLKKAGVVSAVAATGDINLSIGGKNPTKDGYISFTVLSPVNQNVSLTMGSWLKKNTKGEYEKYTKDVFETGVYKFEVQLRTDFLNNGLYYPITNETKLTVNGEALTPSGSSIFDCYVTDGFGYRWFESREYTLRDKFKDVPDNEYYTTAVYSLSDRGVMTGFKPDIFGVGSNLTREDMVTLLWKNEGKPKYNTALLSFKDAKASAYYAQALIWGKQNKVCSGYSETSFGVGDNISRQDFIKIIYGYAKYKGYDISVNSATTYLEKKDASKVSGYAVKSMNWGYEKGLIGKGSDLRPGEPILREDAAVIISRFINKFSK